MRVVGLEVACGDDERRFLPLAAAHVHEDEIALGSALLLLEGDDLAFYRRRGRMLSALRGREVTRGGRALGALKDVVLDEDGAVRLLEVETTDGGGVARARIPYDERVAIGGVSASAA
jgi:sporulation protein YlmC with PRC-barrel domain